MSNAVFPAMPGLAWPIIRQPIFKSLIQRSVSGREIRGTYQQYPLYQFTLKFEFLRDIPGFLEADTLVGFYLSRQGSFDSFLYTDQTDSSVAAMAFGTGDGSTTAFQLTRAFGAGGFTFAEPVQNLNGSPSIFVNGVLKTLTTDYTISATGLVTFVVAPAAAAALTWTGNFYYRCRFLDDQIDPSAMMGGLWELQALNFIGAPGNRV